jgi:tRNA(Arg) A34 adenosine deaminase TadA
MIPPTYKPKKKFMQLAIAEAKRARDRGDYPIGAVITRLIGKREVVIASAGNRVKTSGSSIKHVELETLKYVSSGYGRYLPDFVLYSTHEPCAMCAGACVWSKIGAVVFGVSQEDNITVKHAIVRCTFSLVGNFTPLTLRVTRRRYG